MIYLEETFVTIQWDAPVRCVQIEWRGFVHSDQIRMGLNKGLELVVQKGTDRWLTDTRQLKIVKTEDQNWVLTDWFPRAIAAGITRMSYVIPEQVLCTMTAKRIMSNIKGVSLETAYFDKVVEARLWFLTPRQTSTQTNLNSSSYKRIG